MRPKKILTKPDLDAGLRGPGIRLLLFYSARCPFCSDFIPEFDAASAASGETFLKVCTDDLPELEAAFAVEVVPTVLCFEDGRLRSRLDGALGRGLSAEKLKLFLQACRGEKQP